jgi:hypothetical protein
MIRSISPSYVLNQQVALNKTKIDVNHSISVRVLGLPEVHNTPVHACPE